MSISGKGAKQKWGGGWIVGGRGGPGSGGCGWGGCWDWLKPACLCIYHFVPEEVFVQHSSLTAQKHCGQKPYQRTYWHISFVVLVSQGKATSHFICTSIKLHTFLSVQYSLNPSFFFLLKIINTTLKYHLYPGLLNAILKTIIICNQVSIIRVKVGNIEGIRWWGGQFKSTKLVIYPK